MASLSRSPPARLLCLALLCLPTCGAHALVRSPVRLPLATRAMRAPSQPLMSAKRKKKRQTPSLPPPAALPPPPPPPAASGSLSVGMTVPEGLQSGDAFTFALDDGREFSCVVPEGMQAGSQLTVEVPVEAAAAPAPPPVSAATEPIADVPEVPFPALVPQSPPPPPAPTAPRAPSRYAQGMDDGLANVEIQVPEADLSLLAKVDESPYSRLPTFDEFLARGGTERRETAATTTTNEPPAFQSKLPSINPGSPGYIEPDDGKSPFERFITRGTWIAIGFLVGVEIFINTPLFQQIKPAILKFLADE